MSDIEHVVDDPRAIGNRHCPVCGTVPAQILQRLGKPTHFIHSDGDVHKDKNVRLTLADFTEMKERLA